MPAVPALIMGGSAIGASLFGSHAASEAADKASQRSPEELALMKSQTGLADTQNRQSQQMFGQAMPAIQNTMRYYQTLLGGGRGARQAAVSGEQEDVSNAYAGADAALKRSNVRGGERVAQLAENSRAKAGQVARLVTGVRPGAANALAGEGMGLAGMAEGGARTASQGYSTLIGNSTQNRQQGNLIGMNTGANVTGQLGRLFAQIMSQSKFGKSSSGGGGGGFYGDTVSD